jgi:hypothetical protein
VGLSGLEPLTSALSGESGRRARAAVRSLTVLDRPGRCGSAHLRCQAERQAGDAGRVSQSLALVRASVPLPTQEERRLLNGADAFGTSHLRLVWPQWQGAGSESIRSLASEFPFEVARRGYSVGTKVLQAVLPEHDGPTAVVPVEMGDAGLEERDGIEATTVYCSSCGPRWTSFETTTRRGSARSAGSAR